MAYVSDQGGGSEKREEQTALMWAYEQGITNQEAIKGLEESKKKELLMREIMVKIPMS